VPEFETQPQAEEISREILDLHHESYGTGASNVSVQISPDLIVVIIDVELSPAERTLLGAGQSDAVKSMRESFQVAVSSSFKAIVERATGRRVSSFYSGMSLDPIYTIELFRLEPHPS